jgi:drug/metabolite transporter (DMT)-like permease
LKVKPVFFEQPTQNLILARKMIETKADTDNPQRLVIPKRASRISAPPKVSRSAVLAAFVSICVIWGSTYLAIRCAVETIPPLLMMGIRHITAGGLLYAWARLRGTAAPLRIHWKGAAVTGVFLFLGSHGSLAWAEQRVTSGLAALLSATLPLWIVVLTRITGRGGRLRASVIAGLVLGFLGVAILIGPAGFHSGSSLNLAAAVAVLFGAVSWATGTLYSQRATLPSSSLLSSAMQMVSGGVALLAMATLSGETSRVHLSAMILRSTFALGYLIVFGSIIAFTAFTWLHKHVSATRNSTYAYVNPVVAVFLGWALAGEAVGARTILATITILASVALVSYKPAEPQDVSASYAESYPRRRPVEMGRRGLSLGD